MKISTRILGGMLAFYMLVAPFGIGKGAKLNVTNKKTAEIKVSADGAYKTLEDARDYIRTLDKTKYSEITVKIAAGEYTITEPITFSAEDSGSEDCLIQYVGEDGAAIVGGVALTAADFTKADGGLTEYFPADVRDKMMMVDLAPFGITPDLIEKAMESRHYHEEIPALAANGNRQILAQYPNDWLHIDGAETYDPDWNLTTTEDNSAEYQRVFYGEASAPVVQSWSEVLPVYIRGRIYKLWCPDDSKVIKIYKDNAAVDIYFNGGHEPAPGTILYFYNVPEALDMPGEYIIDKNAILYYYPTETFESDIFSLPRSNGLLRVEGASYLTFENLSFLTCQDDGILLDGEHNSLINCTVAGVQNDGVLLRGDANRMDGCTVHNIGEDGIDVDTGDIENATGIGTVITNCDVYDCSVTNAYGYCITCSGVNLLISHNDCHDSNFKGIHIHNAVDAVIEYNEVWHMMLLSDDVGAISGDGKENANVVFRYNYVHDIGPIGEAAKILDYNPDYKYMGSVGFYFDNGCSYMEVYGNVVDNCDTGYLSNGGRGNSCHNNIVMDCHDWYITFSEIMYSNALEEDGTVDSNTSFDSYVYNETWKKINPDLASLITRTKGEDPLNPLLWIAPVGCTCYDNLIVFNKADRHFSNWGVRPYNIENYVRIFSADGIKLNNNDVTPGEIISYSSKRTDLPIEDVIAEHCDVLGITVEQFNSIGIQK